jgi:hypothetical protein
MRHAAGLYSSGYRQKDERGGSVVSCKLSDDRVHEKLLENSIKLEAAVLRLEHQLVRAYPDYCGKIDFACTIVSAV